MGTRSPIPFCCLLILTASNVVLVFCQLEGQLINFHPSVVATSSSQRYSYLNSPQWAIEGSSERDIDACFQSGNEQGPWWRLDLAVMRGIFNVRVVSAENPSLPDGLAVYVSNGSTVDMTNERAQCGDSFSSTNVAAVTTFDCGATLVGHYIYIATPTTTSIRLALCEVMVNVETGSAEALDLVSIQAEAIQSPEDSDNRTADLAIDGNSTYTDTKCSSTVTGTKPFLRVDLKRPHLVKQVSIKFYGAGGNKTLVQVGGNLIDGGNYQCGDVLSYQTNSQNFYNFTCDEAQLGQYVIVVNTDDASLQVCEVQVFTDSMLDIYLPGSVTASSQLSVNWEIWKAVDQFNSTGNRACYRSVVDMESYWRLELANLKTISMVKITSHKRTDFRDDLQDSKIYVGNKTTNNGKDNAFCGTVPSTANVTIYIQCGNAVTGKYIYVISDVGTRRSLYLCEVELFKPGVPVITIPPQSQQINAGTTVSLTCSAAGTPKLLSVMWMLENKPVSGNDTVTSDVMVNELSRMSTLNVINVGQSTSGSYTCEVTNSEGTVTSSTAIITVLYPPSVTAVMSEVTVLRGSDAILQVAVTGAFPNVPNISTNRSWFDPSSTEITADSKYMFSSDRYNLTIKSVSFNDGGAYTFTAANSVGQSTVTISLKIEDVPVISSAPKGVTINASQTAVFRCVITGNPQPTVTWEKDGNTLPIDIVNTSTTATAFTYTSTLSVSNASGEDAGKYLCKANNSRGNTSSQAAILTVQVKPSVSVINAPTVREGEMATLQVNIYSAIPMVTNSSSSRVWKFPNGSVITPTSLYTISADRYSLSISVVTLSDSGSYIFEARNAAGSGKAIVRLTVTSGEPSITTHPKSIEVNAGGNVNFSCSAEAYPQPDFTWQFGGISLTASESIVINSPSGNEPYTSTLTVKKVNASDAGSYKCIVTNRRGNASSQTAQLTVYVKPDVSATQSTVTMSVGDTAILRVTVTNANPAIVNQNKTWKMGGVELASSTKYVLSNDRLNLNITNLLPGDAGSYIFTASNRAGSGTATFTVRVEGLPIITQQPKFDPNPVSETETVIGTCKANASGSNPQPSLFKWYKDEMEVSTSSQLTLSAQTVRGDLVGTLTITTVGRSDGGEYKCTAISTAGSTPSDSVVLVVHVAPKIAISPTRITAVQGDSKESEFDLTVTNANVVNPKIESSSIVWKYGNSVISQSDGYRFSRNNYIIFIPVKEPYAGQYSVEVTNAAGRALAFFNLSVLVPAQIEMFLSNLTVNETASFTLNCTAHGNPIPQVRLYHQGSTAIDEELIDSKTVSGNALDGSPYKAYTVVQSEGSDSGEYRCAAKNDVKKVGQGADIRTSERTVQVTVNVAPDFIVPIQPQNMSIVNGSILVLHCSATGTPTPTYIWMLDGQEISTSVRHSVLPNGTLKIERVQLEDAGSYVCKVSNLLGSPESAGQMITVYVKPHIIYPAQSFVLNFSSPTEISIGCIAGGIPEPRVEWRLGDTNEIVRNGGKYELRSDTERESSKDVFRVVSNLTIRNPTTNDTRPYVCSSTTNPTFQGVISEVTIHVIVLVAPTFTSSPKNVTVLQTQQAFFQCIVSAAPVSTIEWRRNRAMLPSNSRYTVTKSSVNTSNIQGRPFITTSNLTITNSNYTDAGVYSCRAVNSIGEANSSSAILVVQVAAQISSYPTSQTKNMSDSVMFSCTSTGVPAPDMAWNTTGQAPISSLAVKNSISGTDSILYTTTSDLEVKNLQKSYDGNFTCTSSNGIGMPSVSIPALLTVQVKPRLVAVNMSLIGVENMNLTLAVNILDAFPNVKGERIQWTNSTSNTPLMTNTDMSSGAPFYQAYDDMNKVAYLVIKNISLGSGGGYTCTATNEAGSGSETIRVDTEGAPKFVEKPSNTEVIATQTAELRCETSSVPAAKFMWTKEGENVSDGSVSGFSHLTPSEGQSILMITNVSYDNRGQYKCTAMNKHGSVSAVARLDVQVPPVIISPPAAKTTIEPGVTIFNCNASGQPLPAISWKRKVMDSQTEEQLPSSGKFVIEGNNSLIISDTRYEDRGTYTCVATNKLVEVRMDSSNAELTVHVRPNITVLPQDMIVVSPSTITLTCKAQGNPVPELTWQHNLKEIVTMEPKHSISNDPPSDILVKSTLLVRTSEFKDRGMYSCVVNNLVGQDEAKATVVVQYPAVITSKPTSANVRKPNPHSLNCTTRGFPRPSIQWLKDDTSVLPPTYDVTEINGTNDIGVPTVSSYLTISETNTSDTANITCHVTNIVSAQSETVRVTVQEVPFAPTDVAITSKTSRTVSLSWTAPFDGNKQIISYTVAHTPDDRETVTVDSRPSVTVENLHPYRNYTFTVAASNDIGKGDFSGPSPQVETEEDVPDGAPTITSILPETSKSIRIRWTAVPVDEQNGIILGHQIEIREKMGKDMFGMPFEKKATEKDSFLATELKPFTDYQFRVQAYTRIGLAEIYSSPKSTRTLEDAPSDPPSITSVEAFNSTAVMIEWSAPSIPNGIIRNYSINVTSSASRTVLYVVHTKSNSTTETVGGLAFYTTYNFSVRAYTVGYSNFSEFYTGQSGQHPPSKPKNVVVTAMTKNSLTVKWNPPDNPYGILKGYKVKLTANKMYSFNGETVNRQLTNITNIDDDNIRSLEVVNLTPYTEYSVVVQGRTIDLGEFSDEISGQTLADIPPSPNPPSPVGITATKDNPTLATTSRSFSVRILRGSTINGPISHYQVIVLQLIQNASEKENDRDPGPERLPSSFSQDELKTYQEAMQSSVPIPYIAAEFDVLKFPNNNYFIVGGSDQPSDNSEYTNGAVKENTYYAVFLRTFTNAVEARRKRVPLAERKYTSYSSSPWSPAIQTLKKDETSSTGIIIGAVVAVVVVATIILVILVVHLRRRIQDNEKLYVTTVDTALTDSMEDVSEVPRVGTPSIRLRQMSTVKRNPAAVTYEGPAPVPLSHFAEHVERMHSNGNYIFKQEYEAIQKMSPKHPAEIGIREANKVKNRYANILCFDHSRFKLKLLEDEGSDYINANYLDGFRRQNAYIATQGVIPTTVNDFWRMVWESNSKTVVMITKLKEQGRDKCHQYWPNEHVSETYGTITVENVEEIELSDHVVRTFEVAIKGEQLRTVKQFHFTMWPDHGVPQFFSPLLAFLRRVRMYNPRDDPAGPIIVHCSAGVGRTGTFIVIDTQLQNAEHEKTVDIYNYVSKLREQRNFMVQTEDQYVFVHDAVLESLVSGKTEVSSQNLRRYIANLETKDPDTDQNGFEKQFKLLANSKERANQFHYKQANLDANKKKNRMVNILPYDSSRVCLEISPGVEGSDYINASFIDGYYTRRAFIATQGPIQETVPDFWHMLWKTNSNTIVMLTKLVEKGQERCAQYWPTTQAGRFGALLVTLEKETPGKVYTTREFTVMNTKESVSRTVTQFHYMTWPESGVPDSGAALLDLIGQVERTQQQTGNGPVTVHDSTGVGRTGAFITLSVCIERLKAENTVDVFQTVKLLRTQRPFMVQTTGQLTFCYKTIIEYLDSFDTYSNFK